MQPPQPAPAPYARGQQEPKHTLRGGGLPVSPLLSKLLRLTQGPAASKQGPHSLECKAGPKCGHVGTTHLPAQPSRAVIGKPSRKWGQRWWGQGRRRSSQGTLAAAPQGNREPKATWHGVAPSHGPEHMHPVVRGSDSSCLGKQGCLAAELAGARVKALGPKPAEAAEDRDTGNSPLTPQRWRPPRLLL